MVAGTIQTGGDTAPNETVAAGAWSAASGPGHGVQGAVHRTGREPVGRVSRRCRAVRPRVAEVDDLSGGIEVTLVVEEGEAVFAGEDGGE
jgi:hypothetical protein